MDDISSESIQELAPQRLYSLEGKVAVITGAAGGLGQWLAVGLGAAGASLLLTDRDEEGLDHVLGVVRSAGVTAEGVAVDLDEEGATDQIVQSAVARLGRLDVLVNNAGINKRMPIFDYDRRTYHEIMRIDLEVPFFLSQGAAREMKRQGGGAIVNISSINALYGLEHVSVYGPAKGGLSQLTRVQALEWAEYGIRSNAIAPGFFVTPLSEKLHSDRDIRRWIFNRVPMKRFGRPDELIGLCLLLASDAGSFLTGQTFVADGGFLAGGKWFTPDE